MRIYLICPVRNVTPEQSARIAAYVQRLEADGHSVHYPPRDVDQTDDGCGLSICLAHRDAMQRSDEVHVVWDASSTGSHFDFGMAFAMRKPIVLAEPIEPTPHKSYANVLRRIAK